MTSRETAARAIVARANPKRRSLANSQPVYATDGIEIPRRKRRILLDIAPATVEVLLKAVQRDRGFRAACGDPLRDVVAAERLLVAALEQAR